MKYIKSMLMLAVCGIFVATSAYAETQNVKVSGSIDAYWFYRRNLDLQDNNDIGSAPVGTTVFSHGSAGAVNHRSDADEYFMTITQIQVSADLTDNVSTVINLVNQRDWNAADFSTDDTTSVTTTATGTNEFDVVLDLAYVQMKEIFYSPLTLTIGRQDLLFGRGFIVGWNPQDPQGVTQADEFTQIQSFDAVRATLDFNPWTLDFVYSKIDENHHDPEDDTDLYIANINYQFSEYNAVAEGYYVGHADRAALNGTATASQGSNITHTVGGRVQFDPISQITLGAELAYQFGNYRAAAGNPDRDRTALAVDLFGTYRWDNTWKPELTLEYVHMSGESDHSATSSDYHAWNAPFRGPTYGWIHEYLEGYYATAQAGDQSAGQNLQFLSVTGSLMPMDDLTLSGTYYYFWADEDMHTTIGSVSSPTLSDDLGHEFDVTVTYAYTEDVTFSTMYNVFIPGDAYSSPTDANAHQVVSRVTVVF